MQIVIAVILGIIEGLTEFIPVSSTGHLIIFSNILGFTGDNAGIFEVVIQFGAILATVVVYFDKLLKLFPTKKNNQKKGFAGLRGIELLILTSLPSIILGLIFHDFIKEVLFSPITVAIGLIIGGIGLIVIEKINIKTTTKNIDQISFKQAIGIGLFQVASLFPGTSRAASTIIGGRLLGLNRLTTVEYSFLAAIPIITGASLLDFVKSYSLLTTADLGLIVVGLIVSFLSALVAIRFFLKFINNHSLAVFGWYRIALAIIVILFLRAN